MINATLSDQGHRANSAGDSPGRSNGDPSRRSLEWVGPTAARTGRAVCDVISSLKFMDEKLHQDPWWPGGRGDDARPGDVVADPARITGLAAFAASVVHEVNQPLSGITTNAAICLRVLSRERPDIDAALEAVRRLLRDSNRAAEAHRGKSWATRGSTIGITFQLIPGWSGRQQNRPVRCYGFKSTDSPRLDPPSEMQTRGLQIIQALRMMNFVECPDCLQLRRDSLLDEHVGGVFTNQDAIVSHNDPVLL